MLSQIIAKPTRRRARWLSALLGGAALVGLAAGAAPPTAAQAEQLSYNAVAWDLIQPLGWVDRDPRGVRNGSVLMNEVAANSSGGHIRLTLTGSGPMGPCPGHAQRFLLTWRFLGDVSRIGGQPGQVAVSTIIQLQGDRDSCLMANPYWTIEEQGQMLGTRPGGWGSHYFNDPISTLPVGPETLSVRMPDHNHEGFYIGFAAGWPWPFDIHVNYLYLAEPLGAGPLTPMRPATQFYSETGQMIQGEARGPDGRITMEAATIHQVQCYVGGSPTRSVLIYQYRNRAGFRAIEPPNWGTVIGGHDFLTFDDAASAACVPRR